MALRSRVGAAVVAVVVACMTTPAVGFELITRQEAARRDDASKPQRGSERAGPYPEPEIKIYGNTVTTSPFDLVIELRPGARSAKINLNSLRILYRKDPPVDLKPRLERFVDASSRIVTIRIKGAEAPVGKHQILIQVEDSYEQLTSQLLELDVRPDR